MASRKTGDWEKARAALTGMAKKTQGAAETAALQEGHFLRSKMVEGIGEQAPGGQEFKPLSKLTLLARRAAGFRGTKALIRSGFLRNSITVVREGSHIFIGITRSAREPDGKSLVDVAATQEFGAGPFIVQMTAKMRRFLFGVLLKDEAASKNGGIDKPFWLLRGSGKKTITIRIPARPFIRPVFEKFAKASEMKPRLEERMAKLLRGVLAR